MHNLLLLFSHKLTQDQVKDAKDNLKVEEIIHLPEDLQKKLSNIEPCGELDILPITEITSWIRQNGKEGDFVLIQGEFGATVYIVNYCFKNGFIPIYATTMRIYEEKVNSDGTVERKHIFKHVNFRRYVKP
ncbi:MAG: hypothetical protein LDL13_06095 [Calditerrivibrio sp.]|nr:hypothetical protein [Calditerrivibrio sp.]MCA1980403.1 hypothetical protein [Calditerrivibrio sp.]